MESIPHLKVVWSDESGPDYSSSYQDLATAIVLLAVKDYKKTLRAIWKNPKTAFKRRRLMAKKAELEDFFYSSDYEIYCDINPDVLIRNCRLTAIEDEKKAISRRNKRKIKEQLKENKLHLLERYKAQSNGILSTECEEIRIWLSGGMSVEQCVQLLQIKAQASQKTNGDNYWEACIYKAMSESEEQLIKLI